MKLLNEKLLTPDPFYHETLCFCGWGTVGSRVFWDMVFDERLKRTYDQITTETPRLARKNEKFSS